MKLKIAALCMFINLFSCRLYAGEGYLLKITQPSQEQIIAKISSEYALFEIGDENFEDFNTLVQRLEAMSFASLEEALAQKTKLEAEGIAFAFRGVQKKKFSKHARSNQLTWENFAPHMPVKVEVQQHRE